MAKSNALEGKLVVLIGGSGFFGSNVAQELLDRGARLRVASRNPEKAWKLKPLANLGQMQFARCDVTKPESIAAVMQGADAAAYLVGSFTGDLDAVQARGAGLAAEAAAKAGASAFVQISAIGADANSDIAYSRTKALGEQQARDAFPQATVLRPSILFGEDDNFLNMFGQLIASSPVIPIFGPNAKLQPVWVNDAAEAVANAIADPVKHGGKTYELAGPEVLTMGDINRRIAAAQERKRRFIEMSDSLSSLFASLPGTPMSKDQWNLLQQGSVATRDYPGIEELGVNPHPLGLMLDRWMVRFRKHGRFTKAA
ncbi:complex I NDUFA9 subunit family protein [Altericroceibacterium endophyticum]|uniref:SDR family NAD(P)-dependent oxidoreductase n=1 Tax=Altericroceibacterium endophyticum TaxID=1808508 RepID=A0A6I4T3C0_9SPHN|nr:complex I NDUFA9 subunit family protein [Altericroceibacterium endophyticum]MXO65366.1 SDR family NAD(P)-dependent oxidoreductase [Altericroceibacterium endophyticum]